MSPTRAERRLWIAGAVLVLAWLAFAYGLMPVAIERAHRGEGFGFLARFMAQRAREPVDFYFARWDGIALRLTGFGCAALAVFFTWWHRGRSLGWFARGSLRDLATFRIVVVGAQLLLLLYPLLYSDSPDASPGADPRYQERLTHADPRLFQPIPALGILLAPFGSAARPTADLMYGIWYVAVASGVAALAGVFGRVSVALLTWSSSALVAHAYSYGEYHHTEALLLIALGLLALAPSSAALSFDAWWARRRGAVAADERETLARWPLLAVQWLLALTYLDAGLWKLAKGGLEWFNGYTLAYYFARDGIERGHALGVWLSEHPLLLVPMAVFAVAFELTFLLAVLVPRLAPFYVLVGTALHVGIYVVHGPVFFQHIVLYAAFIEPLRAAWRRWFPTAGVRERRPTLESASPG